jgi:hypothetical protein
MSGLLRASAPAATATDPEDDREDGLDRSSAFAYMLPVNG